MPSGALIKGLNLTADLFKKNDKNNSLSNHGSHMDHLLKFNDSGCNFKSKASNKLNRGRANTVKSCPRGLNQDGDEKSSYKQNVCRDRSIGNIKINYFDALRESRSQSHYTEHDPAKSIGRNASRTAKQLQSNSSVSATSKKSKSN